MAFRRASMSLNGTCSNPGTRGSNGSRKSFRQVALRASMKAAHRRDDRLPSCRGARKLDRGLDGLGARIAQEDPTEVSRCDGEELLDEGRFRGCPEHGSDVDELPRLGLDCLDDGRIAMS